MISSYFFSSLEYIYQIHNILIPIIIFIAIIYFVISFLLKESCLFSKKNIFKSINFNSNTNCNDTNIHVINQDPNNTSNDVAKNVKYVSNSDTLEEVKNIQNLKENNLPLQHNNSDHLIQSTDIAFIQDEKKSSEIILNQIPTNSVNFELNSSVERSSQKVICENYCTCPDTIFSDEKNNVTYSDDLNNSECTEYNQFIEKTIINDDSKKIFTKDSSTSLRNEFDDKKTISYNLREEESDGEESEKDDMRDEESEDDDYNEDSTSDKFERNINNNDFTSKNRENEFNINNMNIDEDVKQKIIQAGGDSIILKNLGNEYFNKNDFTNSIIFYSEALENLKDESCMELKAILLSNRAACQLNFDNIEYAIFDSNEAIKANPLYVKAYLRRASAYEKKKNWHDASADLKKAIELQPELISKYGEKEKRISKLSEDQFNKEKDELIGKAKEFGNMLLGKVGLSLDNFKVEQNPETGSYNIQFQQNK